MKKILLLIAFWGFVVQHVYAQAPAGRVVGPAEKSMVDSICSELSRKDLSKLTSKAEAMTMFTKCVTDHADLLMALAEERKVELTDDAGMSKIGVDIAADLMKSKCPAALKVLQYMAGTTDAGDNVSSSTTGTLKRIDNKGFNYIVITDNGSEKSFLWLRQFKDSEKFTGGLGANAGKKVKITWEELEVYIPAANGYYKVKEITELSFL